ncbi:cilia- and flagella-associated protein 61-like isoform X2 [Ptychodera flava]|uniref:cilia- and flagella-associated protein 61-like isoform X2 n=1 Tax=Ptychodera flava TaxID=63121 RepID=UPI00396A0FD6
MTTLMSSDGPAEVINARRTESLDAPNILKLVTPSTESLFGLVNVVHLIEKAILAVTLHNDHDEVLAHAAFFDYPNISGVDAAKWQNWMSQYYDCKTNTPLNSAFMHYFVSKPEFSHGSAREIIRTAFNAVPDLHFIYLVVPQNVFPDPSLADIFKPLSKKHGGKVLEKCTIFVCHRHDLCPVLFVRKARVEDHDDLTPIFNHQSDMLTKTYGDYFLAELIEAQDDNNHALVTEVDGTAIGFMSICGEVSNLDLLNECFELGPFNGLRKPHPDDILEAPREPSPEPLPVPTPAAPGTATDEERPDTQGSVQKSERPESGDSKKGDLSTTPAAGKTPSVKGTPLPTQMTPGSQQPASREGTEGEVKVKTKLSEAHMGESTTSLPTAGAEADSRPGSAKSGHSSKASASGAKSPPAEEMIEEPPAPERTPTPQLPSRLKRKTFKPVYNGPSNCFCIQLFCIDERYEMRSMDFLPMAFELFPDRDFCMVTMPHLIPEFPLLQNFVRVTPRCPSTLPQELYVFNRSGLMQNFMVSPVCKSDVPEIEKLVSSLEQKEHLMADLQQYNLARRDPNGTPIQAFIAKCLDQIVGVAVTRREEDIEYIRSHYNIEDFIYFNHHRRQEHGHLHHFALNPIFQHYSKHFLKEVLRQSHHSCLYYPVYPPYTDQEISKNHSLVSALNFMVPVRARRQIVYPKDKLGENAPSDRVCKEEEKYALNHINRKLTLEPKVTVNARIVVVGASDVGISFLETLTFCPHLRFNNLTLISPNGLPGELPPDPVRSSFLSQSQCYSQDELSQISLRSWVNVVFGKMIAINRVSKYVVVTGGARVPYDHLVLATGQQYQVSAPTEANVDQLLTNEEVPNSPNRRFSGVKPSNTFVINDEYDAFEAKRWLIKRFLNTEGKAIVYGNTIDAYATVQTLLTIGVPGERIQLVEPPRNYQPSCFNNSTVEKAIAAVLAEKGIQLYSGFYLAQWNDGKGGDEICKASFTSETKPITLECSVFFCYNRQAVDYEAFKAINDSCLVYDGKLVIDGNFHTNDLAIRAAGPLTKFQRKYHADQWTHANFNSKEVGFMLASTMLRLFDPTIENDARPPAEPHNLIPMYRNAKVVSASLPGDYNYLYFGKPSLNQSLDALMAQQDYGEELITGHPESESTGYFRIHVNQYNQIETVTCLSKQPVDTGNLLCLYGLHERLLNNMMSRFQEGLIKDFYAFFRETWSLAIFHDRFGDFRQEVRELLIQRPSTDMASLEEKVRDLIDQDLQLEKKDRKFLNDAYEEGGYKRSVETRLLSFLSYNHYHLPMYAKPGMV